MKILSITDSKVQGEVLSVLRGGEVAILPTDTVYGIACDAENMDTKKKIFDIKNRDAKQQIAWLIADMAMAEKYLQIKPEIKEKLKNVWPGAFTGIFESLDKNRTIGVRIPNYRFLQDLIDKFGRPVAATSANISGNEPCTKIADIIKIFGADERVACIVDAGDLPDSMASTVVDFVQAPPKVLRVGSVDPAVFL